MELLSNGVGKLSREFNQMKFWKDFCQKHSDVEVQIVVAEDCGDAMQYFGGIDYALDHRNPNLPLIIFSLVPIYVIIKKQFQKFMLLLSHSQVIFCDGLSQENPFELEDGFDRLIKKVINKESHLAGLAYFSTQQKINDLSGIHHDINCLDRLANPERCARAAKQARLKLGFIGTDDEVVDQIITENNKQVREVKLAGQNFPGIFCDVQGTLLLSDDKTLNLPVYNWLKEQEKLGFTITIWTGGDTDKMATSLYSTDEFLDDQIQWPVVGKSAFAGASVEIAIDDQPLNLKNDFAIEAKRLINVSEIIA